MNRPLAFLCLCLFLGFGLGLDFALARPPQAETNVPCYVVRVSSVGRDDDAEVVVITKRFYEANGRTPDRERFVDYRVLSAIALRPYDARLLTTYRPD